MWFRWLQGKAGLLAAENPRTLDDMSRGFEGDGGLSGFQLLMISLAAIALGLLLVRAARQMAKREGESFSCSRQLFQDLCQAHELKRKDRHMLRRLATARRLEQPAELFLSPASFELSGLPAHWKPHQVRLREIKQHLFASEKE